MLKGDAVFLCENVRTPFGRFAGALSSVRPDDLGAHAIRALMDMTPDLDTSRIADVIFGNANQAGEDNRNVARMSLLLAGLPETVSGTTVNRLCGSGMDAIAIAARLLATGGGDVAIAGGTESMSRAPYVVSKSGTAFARDVEMFDTSIGWRFINPKLQAAHGTDSMPETAEIVAERFNVSREDQDAFSVRSQAKAAEAQLGGWLAEEISPVPIPQRKGDPIIVSDDEHLRPGTDIAALSRLRPIVKPDGTITAGNASGVNDGACAVIVATEVGIKDFNLTPIARLSGFNTVGVEPRIMGMGPLPASQGLLEAQGVTIDDVDVIELNEAFASQSLAVMRSLGLEDDDPRVNPNGGAIAIGHPLGASGTRIVMAAAREMARRDAKRSLAAMCIGVGQGIATLMERP